MMMMMMMIDSTYSGSGNTISRLSTILCLLTGLALVDVIHDLFNIHA